MTSGYAYQLAEEAFLCHHGSGEILLRGQWVRMEPGDMAYVPESAIRALRNRGSQDFILVNQITPSPAAWPPSPSSPWPPELSTRVRGPASRAPSRR